MNSYQRKVGAGADAKELEYVSALHQTCMPNTRGSATISSLDVQRYLVSRHGIQITPEHAKDIIQGLGGTQISETVSQQVHEKLQAKAQAELKRQEDANSSSKFGVFGSKSFDSSASASGKKKPSLMSIWNKKGREEQVLEDEEKNEQAQMATGLPPPSLEYLDIIQWTSILLIPTLVRYSAASEAPNSKEVSGDETAASPSTDSGAPPLEPRPPELISTVWKLLAAMGSEGTSGASSVPLLTPDYIRELLVGHGEYERAQDDSLIDEMISLAGGGSQQVFDEGAFLRALTADVLEWKAGTEDNETTFVRDVFGTDGLSKLLDSNEEKAKLKSPASSEEDEEAINDKVQKEPNLEDIAKANSLKIIDSVVDSYASFTLLLITWIFYMAQGSMYANFLRAADFSQASCTVSDGGGTSGSDFGCTVGSTIWTWLTLAFMLTIMGVFVVTLLNFGNHPTKRSPGRMFLAMIIVAILTAVPMLALEWYRSNKVEPPYDAKEEIVTDGNFKGSQIFTFSMGTAVFAIYLVQFLLAIIKKNKDRLHSLYQFFEKRSMYQTAHDRGTIRSKQAGTRKLNKFLENAYKLHIPKTNVEVESENSLRTETESEATFRNFVLYGETHEECASLIWTWRNLLSGRLFDTEGVWIPTRVMIFQAAQVAFGLFVCTVFFVAIEGLAQVADDAVESLPDDEAIPDWVYDIVPNGKQVRIALLPAASISVTVMFTIIATYLPSLVTTVFKFRCGHISSLGSDKFFFYRKGPDFAYMNTANAIYAMLAAAAIFFLLFGLLLFLFIWDFSRPLMILIVAWGIGLGVTIMAKKVLTGLWRSKYFKAFYRTNPRGANLSALALECWFIGLGGGVLVARLSQFLIASAFWIGRIDVPFLSDDVSLMGYAFDYVPMNFMKEILVHEAHRHPYIERLGGMYMMRLRHGKKFGSAAGAAWRQLLLVALCPWLIKYRVQYEQRVIESHQDIAAEKIIEEEENRTAVENLKETANDYHAKVGDTLENVGEGATKIGTAGVEVVGDVGRGVTNVVNDSVRKVSEPKTA